MFRLFGVGFMHLGGGFFLSLNMNQYLMNAVNFLTCLSFQFHV